MPARRGARKPPTLLEAVQKPQKVPLSLPANQAVRNLAHAGAPRPCKKTPHITLNPKTIKQLSEDARLRSVSLLNGVLIRISLSVVMLSCSPVGTKAVSCTEQMACGKDKDSYVSSGRQPALVAD